MDAESEVHNPVIGVHHNNCIDGTVAAAVFLEYYPHAQTFPLRHGFTEDNIAPILDAIDSSTDVYTLDCALGVEQFLEQAQSVTTIDHHRAIHDELSDRTKEHGRFSLVYDSTKSGASLAWEYFFPQRDEPWLVTFAEDIDLFRWQYSPESDYAAGYLSMLRNKPDEMRQLLHTDKDEILPLGKVIHEYAQKNVNDYLKKAEPLWLTINGHSIPAFDNTYYKSEIGNIKSQEHDCPAIIFSIYGHNVTMSIRSLKGHEPNALAVAQMLDGGGNPHSAGARVDLDTFMQMVR